MTDRRNNKTIEITYRDEVGETDGRSFAKWMGIGATAMMLLLIMTLSMGMVAGALGVGMGGFVASFGEVVVDGVEAGDQGGGAIYPVLGENPACAEAPQLNANLPGTAHIGDHVAFYKDLPLPWGDGDVARVNIVSDDLDPWNESDVELQDLDLRLSALNASELSLEAPDGDQVEIVESAYNDTGGDGVIEDNQEAYDAYGVDDDGDVMSLGPNNLQDNAEFGIAIPEDSNVTIDDGIAAAHQVAFSDLTIPNVDLFVTIGDPTGDPDDFEANTSVADRHVDPDERTCASLANASGPGEFTDDDGDPAYP